jgi:hypothetical protein
MKTFKQLLEMAFAANDLHPTDEEVSGSSHEIKKYKDNQGNSFFVKSPNRELYNSELDPELHVLVEYISYFLYQIWGVKVPFADLYIKNDELMLASKATGGSHIEIEDLFRYKDFVKGFAVDVFIANWDVTGTGWVTGNLLFDEEGNVTRIDPGGSLTFRARGTKKGEGFNSDVTEFDTMRNPKISVAADAYNTHRDLVKQSLDNFTNVSWSEAESKLRNFNQVQIIEPIKSLYDNEELANELLNDWEHEFKEIMNKLRYRYAKLVSLRTKI